MRARRLIARFILAAFILLSVLALPRAAPAQPAEPTPTPAAPAPPPPAADAAKDQAKEHFLRGVEHVQNNEWDAALAEFLQSRELFPTIAATKNAAIALRQLKRYPEALAMYEELLERHGPSLRPDESQAATEAITQLRANVGEVLVTSDQKDSTVIVDGQERGTTPLENPIVLAAGTHSIRVYKEGFVPFEEQLVVAGKQRKTIDARLKGLTSAGQLRVTETTGKPLDVVVDGAVVGKAPWQGTLSVGTHTVFLRGDGDVGTPPSAATVFAGQLSSLALKAVALDSELRIEPTPSNARVDIDGVQVGNGVWEGRLKSGSHDVEVSAKGFLAYRRKVGVKAGQREVVTVALERDLADPTWRSRSFVPHVYAEVVGGPGLAPGFGGSADVACSNGRCSERSRPFGVMAGARGGYQLTSGLGLEVFIGFISLSESMTRSVTARSDTALASDDFRDTTTLTGAMSALSASYQLFERTPLLFRVWAGAGRVQAKFSNAGTFTGAYAGGHSGNVEGEAWHFRQELSALEAKQSVWLPFIGPEVRFGFRFSRAFAIDLGVAGLLAFAPEAIREDPGGGEVRKAFLKEYGQVLGTTGSATLVSPRPGLARLDREAGLGTMFLILPTLGARLDF